MLRTLSSIVLLGALAIACAQDGKPESKSAHDASNDESPAAEHASGDEGATRHADDDGGNAEHSKKSESDKSSVPEPEFKEGMSVDEATKAVPTGIERRNIDQETLGKPLQELSVYEPCKPGSARVKLKVAVWDGRAVGIDVSTTPKNEKLAECIKQRIAELKWEKKVKSLNTIEYQL